MYINKMLKYVRELDQFHCNFAYKWKQNINNNKKLPKQQSMFWE